VKPSARRGKLSFSLARTIRNTHHQLRQVGRIAHVKHGPCGSSVVQDPKKALSGFQDKNMNAFVVAEVTPMTPPALVRAQIDAVVLDLGRLETIVDDAASQLLSSFGDIQQSFTVLDPQWMSSPAFTAVGKAVTALQFHDMATQLVAGAKARLKVAAEGLSTDTANLPPSDHDALLKKLAGMPKPEGVTNERRDGREGSAKTPSAIGEDMFPKQPVQQDSVTAGSIDLF
jgi:hypothetical protein